MAIYLDCNATTPIDPRVGELMVHYLTEEFGNAGSRTHAHGARAKKAVETARGQVAALIQAKPDEVIFTSGATESNNLALLGLASHGESVGRKHIISTQIEHKAVLEPLEVLEARGFEVDLVPPTAGGWVDPAAVASLVRSDTLLVSVMSVNNETGVVQPIGEIAELLAGYDAYLHVDGAQGFGKEVEQLKAPRIDLLSVSGHKIYGPKGVGALIARRRRFKRPPLEPLTFGGGQEKGLRPGTLPVPQIAGLGLAAELAGKEWKARRKRCLDIRAEALDALRDLDPQLNGDSERVQPHVLNVCFRGLDSEAVMVALKDAASVSNGSACTSSSYKPSHVLKSMGAPESVLGSSVRISWWHGLEDVDWRDLVDILAALISE